MVNSVRDLPEWQAARAVMEDDFDTEPNLRFRQVIEAAIRMREIEAAFEAGLPVDPQEWWVTTGAFAQGGKKVLGPFRDQELALKVRGYIEKAENWTHLWVDQA